MEIKTPQFYINEKNATKQVGKLISGKVSKALIIWSKTARKVAYSNIISGLQTENIEYEEILFAGFPTLKKARDYAEKAKNGNYDGIIAVGGGKVMDVSKAAGNIADITIITVPTIAATCAAWAAVSIIYTEEGDFEQFYPNSKTANIVVADTKIIVEAPVRYIRAGIVDTMAKWYETSSGSTPDDSFEKLIAVSNSKIALHFLHKHSVDVIKKVQNGIIDETVKKTIDAIIYIAGNVGSYVGEKAYSGFAHPFYHSARRIPETRNVLHGELVAYGLLMQAVLEGKSQEEVKDLIKIFSEINEAFLLKEIGFGGDTGTKLEIVAERIIEEFEVSPAIVENLTVNAIVDAAYNVDRLVRYVRRESGFLHETGK